MPWGRGENDEGKVRLQMGYIDTPATQRANRRYIERSMRTAMLTRDREFELARRWRDKRDESALEELILAYSRLVIKIAGKFRHYGLPMGDLVQEGNVGLLQAAERFEPEREFRFSTYASWWVRSAMQEYVLRNWSIVRTGTTAAQKALFFNLRRLRAKHADQVDGWLSPESKQRIAAELKVKNTEVADMEMRLYANDQSLNVAISESGEDEWQDFLPDEGPTPEDQVLKSHDGATRSGWLRNAMGELTERERTIIAQRRLSEDVSTLGTLGVELGISKERVRQIEQKALEKLKVSMHRQLNERPNERPAIGQPAS